MAWEVPRLWSGETAAVLATGPSMSQEAADKVRGRCRVIAVNDAYRLAPWADVLYAADAKWWQHHKPEFAGLKVSISCGGWNKKRPPLHDMHLVESGGKEGFDTRRTHVRTGRNSAYQAAHLAAHFGASKVLLIGCDMGGSHFFGEHPKALQRHSPYDLFLELFRSGGPAFAAQGVQLINCTPKGRLLFLPTMEIEEALA